MVMITTAIAIMTISAIRTAQPLYSFYHCGMTSNICDSYLGIVNRTSLFLCEAQQGIQPFGELVSTITFSSILKKVFSPYLQNCQKIGHLLLIILHCYLETQHAYD